MTQPSIRQSGRPRESRPIEPDEPLFDPFEPGALAGRQPPRSPAARTPEWAPEPELAPDSEPFESLEPQAPRPTLAQRLRRVPPGAIFLGTAAVASLGFLLAQLASRTASVPLLTSAAVVAGLVWVVVAGASSAGTLRMRQEGRLLESFLFALLAGFAAIGSAVAFAGALVLFMALGF